MMGETETRKLEHIQICTERNVQSDKTTLLECVQLKKSTEPIAREEICCTTKLFGKKLKYPIIISGMTGGVIEAEQINKNLAKSAEQLGIGFGLGSQRAMLENPGLKHTYEVRDVAPNILLIGNIGAPQLLDYSPSEIENMALAIDADILAIHLNSVQEQIQPEGTLPDIDVSEKVKELCSEIEMPVILKETGFGITAENAKSFKESGLEGVDVGGAGGTSFARVELERIKSPALMDFEDSGIPTAASILEVRTVFPKIPLIATGGIRTGDDVAKAFVLGADAAGVALPLLKPAQKSSNAVIEKLEEIIIEFEKTMSKTGSKTIKDLKSNNSIISGKLKEWV